MIEAARKNLTEMGIMDKFELVCSDIFDEKFALPEKVDCVVLSFAITAFINNYEMLAKILSQCSKQVKPDGYMLVADFGFVSMPKDNWWAGMYTTTDNMGEDGKHKEFEPFKFII